MLDDAFLSGLQPRLPSNAVPKRHKNAISIYFFTICSIYLAPSGAKYCETWFGRFENWRGMIGKPILELLIFGSHPDVCDFGFKLSDFEQHWP